MEILFLVFFCSWTSAVPSLANDSKTELCEMDLSPVVVKVGDSFYQSYFSQIFTKSNCSPEIVNLVEENVLNTNGKIPTEHLLGIYATKVKTQSKFIEVLDLSAHLKNQILNSKSKGNENNKYFKLDGSNQVIGLKSLKEITWTWGKDEHAVEVNLMDKNEIAHKISFNIETNTKNLVYKAKKDISALNENLKAEDFELIEIQSQDHDHDQGNINNSNRYSTPFMEINKISYYRTNGLIKKGETLFTNSLSPMNLIETGKMIKVLGDSQGVEVRAEGRAMGPGFIGQTITIENQKSKRKYSAEVIDFNTVKLQL